MLGNTTSPTAIAALIVLPQGTARLALLDNGADALPLAIGSIRVDAIGADRPDRDLWTAYHGDDQTAPNEPATRLARSLGWAGRSILCGPVVFLGGSRSHDVPPEVIVQAIRLTA